MILIPIFIYHKKKYYNINQTASRGAGPQNVTVKSSGLGFDPHSSR